MIRIIVMVGGDKVIKIYPRTTQAVTILATKSFVGPGICWCGQNGDELDGVVRLNGAKCVDGFKWIQTTQGSSPFPPQSVQYTYSALSKMFIWHQINRFSGCGEEWECWWDSFGLFCDVCGQIWSNVCRVWVVVKFGVHCKWCGYNVRYGIV